MGFEDYSHPFNEYDGGGYFFLFFCFSKNKKRMVAPSGVSKDTKDIGLYYNFDDQILSFYT